MEELLGSLESSLTVRFDPLSTSKQHPRFSQFKQKTHKISQEERRRATLETQKRLVGSGFQLFWELIQIIAFLLSGEDMITKVMWEG